MFLLPIRVRRTFKDLEERRIERRVHRLIRFGSAAQDNPLIGKTMRSYEILDLLVRRHKRAPAIEQEQQESVLKRNAHIRRTEELSQRLSLQLQNYFRVASQTWFQIR